MNYNDHTPAHFHARYQDFEVTIEIESGLVQGAMPRRALNMLFEWTDRYRAELWQNWEHSQNRQPLDPIPPFV